MSCSASVLTEKIKTVLVYDAEIEITKARVKFVIRDINHVYEKGQVEIYVKMC